MSAEFDEHAESYEESLESALGISGENRDYFAAGRMRFLSGLLAGAGRDAGNVLDFGCGTGNGIPHAVEWLLPERMSGADVSVASLNIAKKRFPDVSFGLNGEISEQMFDTIYCNGVIHHVPSEDRRKVFAEIHRATKPGGWFALFENSKWNPATRFVMSRCVFDHNAEPLSAIEARRWMREAGFRILGTRYLFIFPRALAALRGLESSLSPLPLGTQYVVWGVKE
jgi:ubiquinone/menaquinone biosynthesis C-methylase UbiE